MTNPMSSESAYIEPVPTPDLETQRKAQRTVLRMARDKADAHLILAALDLDFQ